MKDSEGRRLDNFPVRQEALASRPDGWFARARHGLFVHRVWGGAGTTMTVNRNGTVAATLDG
ncbi:hypothetical protein [Gordonia oryzae]|nr:hypothetical protein [Gordonia oryzae]